MQPLTREPLPFRRKKHLHSFPIVSSALAAATSNPQLHRNQLPPASHRGCCQRASPVILESRGETEGSWTITLFFASLSPSTTNTLVRHQHRHLTRTWPFPKPQPFHSSLFCLRVSECTDNVLDIVFVISWWKEPGGLVSINCSRSCP